MNTHEGNYTWHQAGIVIYTSFLCRHKKYVVNLKKGQNFMEKIFIFQALLALYCHFFNNIKV